MDLYFQSTSCISQNKRPVKPTFYSFFLFAHQAVKQSATTEDNAAFAQVVRGQFNSHFVARQDADVVLRILPEMCAVTT